MKEETKRKLSIINKGKTHTLETKRKMSEAQSGKVLSVKHKKNISKAKKLLEQRPPSFKGCKHTEETKEKLRLARKKQKFTQASLDKMAESMRRLWDKRGRVNKKRYKHQNDAQYRQWRSDIFERDNWTCQTCQSRGCYLEAHHIKSWAKYSKLRYVIDNGVTLCLDCHKLTDNYKGRINREEKTDVNNDK